ncbi:MAG: ABC transporter ATP-binding protein [Planctomycetaceae bacterium]|nr:MAG: ABC transporter ATP-binding protein [Planctomycetaceae bacterium]
MGGTGELAIRCRGLVKTYPGRIPVEAVRGIDLDVPVGECFGLLGPNGAGKTTTMGILEGLLDATAGDVEVLGRRWGRDDREIRERIGVSLQETNLADKLTVGEIVRLFRSFYRNGISAEQAIAHVALEEKVGARFGKLSGGQKQRLAIACALVGDPELLFLDEPTTGLDPQSRRQVWEVISESQSAGRTIILTTHYMDEAERLCDRVAIVDQGRVIALGSPAQLIAQLGSEHVLEPIWGGERQPDAAELRGLTSVTSVRQEADRWNLSVAEPHLAMPALFDLTRDRGLELSALTTRHATLEDVFVKLTGRHLRDGEGGEKS